ncbi:hypothetical protein ACI2TD_18065 [Ralstonia nicotianae]
MQAERKTMDTLKIGQLSFELHESEPQQCLSPNTEALRTAEKIGDNLHRLVWWSGRVSYVIEFGGQAVPLSVGRALTVSRLIAADEQARRAQPRA